MENIKIILGPPGTGKTTRLLNLVDEYLQKGVTPEKIGFISFTKKSVTEAKERAAKKFNKPLDWFQYFRTIHSLSFYQLSMSRAEVMNRHHYVELGKHMGLQMTGIHRQDQMIYEMSKGDQLVFIESLARMMCKSYEDIHHMLNPDIDIYEIIHFAESLVNFKKSRLLNDFTDMLTKFYEQGYKPDLDVLFVDEAQDLCKIQWKIVEEMSKKSKITYIAGDDDQAIFRWSGADIDYFQKISEESSTEVLGQSYRLPNVIHKFSNDLINKVGHRAKKEFKPRPEEGLIDYISSIEDVDLEKGEWLILVRNSFLIRDIVDHIRYMGYAYETVYYSLKDDEAIKCALTWEALRAGKEETTIAVVEMLTFIDKKNLGKKLSAKGKDDVITLKKLVSEGYIKNNVEKLIWHEALSLIPVDDREYYISVRRRGENLTGKPRIKISTIHGAKGGEAENVVLFTDMSNRTYKGMMENEDDELRVFYVGATRAKKNLYIVQPSTLNCIHL